MARPRKRSNDGPRAVVAQGDEAGLGAEAAAASAPVSAAMAPAPGARESQRAHARLAVASVAFGSLVLGLALGAGPLAPVRVSAWAALVCLATALGCSPLSELARRVGSPRARAASELLVRARRGIGVTAFAFALAHACLALALHLGADVRALLAVDRFRHGALALLLLSPLALTSSRRVTAALRLRGWKALHRAVYPAAILALAHAVRGPFVPPRAALGAAGVLVVLFLTRPLLALVRRGPMPGSAGGPVTER